MRQKYCKYEFYIKNWFSIKYKSLFFGHIYEWEHWFNLLSKNRDLILNKKNILLWK